MMKRCASLESRVSAAELARTEADRRCSAAEAALVKTSRERDAMAVQIQNLNETVDELTRVNTSQFGSGARRTTTAMSTQDRAALGRESELVRCYGHGSESLACTF